MVYLNLKEAVMQSFTSIGPMLDFIALFSVIALYSGSLLPFVVIFSFLLSYFTLYTIYALSKKYITNGGYYSYAGNILGRDFGIFIFLLYIMYSILTVPNISMFISGFIYSIFNLFGIYNIYLEYIFIFIFVGMVYLVVSAGLKVSIKYTLIAGFLEIMFILIMSTVFIVYRSPNFSFSGIKFSLNEFFFGVIFGILAFSGGGSSIFLSETTEKSHKNTPKSLFISFTISGIIMSISAFALLVFAGYSGLSDYITNSFYITELVFHRLGFPFLIVFAFFGIMSGFNLSVSYLNAFINLIPRFYNDFNIKKMEKKKLMLILFLISILISMVSTYFIGVFASFVIIAGIISFIYIIIHIISNISLIKLYAKNKFFIPVISSIFLIFAFILSFISNIAYYVSINYFILIYILIAIAYIIYLKRNRLKFYSNIKFEYK